VAKVGDAVSVISCRRGCACDLCVLDVVAVTVLAPPGRRFRGDVGEDDTMHRALEEAVSPVGKQVANVD
jgi:hypothetical protein